MRVNILSSRVSLVLKLSPNSREELLSNSRSFPTVLVFSSLPTSPLTVKLSSLNFANYAVIICLFLTKLSRSLLSMSDRMSSVSFIQADLLFAHNSDSLISFILVSYASIKILVRSCAIVSAIRMFFSRTNSKLSDKLSLIEFD